MFTQIPLPHVKEEKYFKKVIHQQIKNACFFATNFTVKREYVFVSTQKQTSLQRFLILTNGKNVISTAKFTWVFLKELCV